MQNKYKIGPVLAFFMFVCIFCSLRAEAAKYGDTIKIGYVQDYGILIDKDGTATGYLADYLNEISKYTGWSYEYIGGSWPECLERLKTGELDLMGMMHKIPGREEFFDFSSRKMGIEYGTIYISENRTSIFYNDPKSLNGIKMATLGDSFYEIPMKKYCDENGIDVELIYDDAAEFAGGLAIGRYDAVLAGSTHDIQGSVVAGKISSDPFYFAVPKGSEATLESLEDALERISIEDAYFDSKLFQRYFGNKSISKPAFSVEETEYLDTRPVLNVVCNPNWIPISFTEEDDREVQGIAINLLNKLCENTGISLQYSTADTFEEGMERINNKSAQLLIGFEQYEDSRLWYTDSILDFPMVIAGAGDIYLKDHIRVGIHSPSKRVGEDFRRYYPNFEYVDYSSAKDILKAMERGEEKYGIFNYYAFDELKRNAPDTNFQMSVTEVTVPIVVSVSKSADKNILSILNKSMRRISQEEISSIAFKNSVDRSSQAAFQQILHNNRMYIVRFFMLVALIVVAVIVTINYKNKRALRKMAYYDELTGVYSIDKFKLLYRTYA